MTVLTARWLPGGFAPHKRFAVTESVLKNMGNHALIAPRIVRVVQRQPNEIMIMNVLMDKNCYGAVGHCEAINLNSTCLSNNELWLFLEQLETRNPCLMVKFNLIILYDTIRQEEKNNHCCYRSS